MHRNCICDKIINIYRISSTLGCFKWSMFVFVIISAGVPQGSLWVLLLFLIYINDLSNDVKNRFKWCADNRSLFSKLHDIDTSAIDLNHDL